MAKPTWEETEPAFDETEPIDVASSNTPQFEETLEIKPEQSTLPSFVDKLKETGQDFGASSAEGLTLGSSAELGGAEQAWLHSLAYNPISKKLGVPELLDIPKDSQIQTAKKLEEQGFIGDIGPKSYKELYRQSQKENEQLLEESAQRSPTASTLGEIGGAVLGAAALPLAGATKATRGILGLGESVALKEALKTGGIKGLAKEAGAKGLVDTILGVPAGALYGLGTSEATVDTEEDRTKLMKDIAGSAATGGILSGAIGLGAQTAPLVAQIPKDIIKSNITLEQMARAFKEGAEGTFYPSKQVLQQTMKPYSLQQSQKLTKEILQKDQQLSSAVGQALKSDDNFYAIPSEILGDISNIKTFAKQNLFTKDSPQLQKFINYLEQNIENRLAKSGSPNAFKAEEVKSLSDKLSDYAESLNPQTQSELRSELQSISNKTRSFLKENSKPYRDAAEELKTYRSNVQDEILNKGVSPEFRTTKFSDISRPDRSSEFRKKLQTVIEDAYKPGESYSQAGNVLNNLKSNLQKLKQESPDLAQKFNLDKALADIEEASLQSSTYTAARGDLRTEQSIPLSLTGLAQSLGVNTANLAGTATKLSKTVATAPGKAVRNVYSLSQQKLSSLGDKLSATQNKALRDIGDSMKRIANEPMTSDSQRRARAALFVLQQQVDGRKALDEFFGEEDEGKQ